MKSAAVRLVEAAYRLDLPTSEWFCHLAEAAASLTPERTGAMAYAFDGSQPTVGVAIASHGSHGVDDDFVEGTFDLNRTTRKTEAELFYRGAIVCGTVSERLGSTEELASGDNSYARTMAARGYPDSFGVTASAADLRGIVINAPLSAPIVLSPQRRRLWLQMAEHLRTGERLKRHLAAAPENPVAVVAPSGVVVHAAGPARRPGLRERLRAAARDIDAARSRRGPDDAHEALALWNGLLDGRWSLVEQFERDGRRYFIVHENRPGARDPRALTAREREVVELVAQGRANKHIAHDLGVSLGTVAKLLQRALDKLGFESRQQLIWVHRRVRRRVYKSGMAPSESGP